MVEALKCGNVANRRGLSWPNTSDGKNRFNLSPLQRLRLPHAPKSVDIITEANVGIARILVIAVTGATILRAESPSAAAQHFVLAFARSTRILLRRFSVVVHFVKIIAPLPDIAGHIVKAPGIRLLLPHRPRMSTGILLEPGVVTQFSWTIS